MTCSVLTYNRVVLVGKCKGVRDIFGSKSCGVAPTTLSSDMHMKLKIEGRVREVLCCGCFVQLLQDGPMLPPGTMYK